MVSGGEGEEPVGHAIEKGESLEVGKRHHHDVAPLHLHFRELLEFFAETVFVHEVFPFRIDLQHVEVLDFGEIAELVEDFRAEFHKLGDHLVLHLRGDAFSVVGTDDAHDHLAELAIDDDGILPQRETRLKLFVAGYTLGMCRHHHDDGDEGPGRKPRIDICFENVEKAGESLAVEP